MRNITTAIQCIDNDKTWTMGSFIFEWEENGSESQVDLTRYIKGMKMDVDDVNMNKNAPLKQSKNERLSLGWSMGYQFSAMFQETNFQQALLPRLKVAARKCGFELCVTGSKRHITHLSKNLGCRNSRVHPEEKKKGGDKGVQKENISNGKRQKVGARNRSDPRATSTMYAIDKDHRCTFKHISLAFFFREKRWILKMNNTQDGCNHLAHCFHSFVPYEILAGSKIKLQPKSVIDDSKSLSQVNSTEGQIANFLTNKYGKTYTPQDVNAFLRNIHKDDPSCDLNPAERLVNHLRSM